MTWKDELKKWPRWVQVMIAVPYYWGIQIKAWWNRVKFEAERKDR